MRLDQELVRRSLARSRASAVAAINAGKVQVSGQVVTKASRDVSAATKITVVGIDHYVSRAAHKLIGALEDSQSSVPARVLDAGASTGGFTQVLLERGAQLVYAVDVGHGQLAPQLREDARVAVLEGVNLRELTLDHVEGEPVAMVVADVSFISLRLLLAPILQVLRPDGRALLLVKPQFEVGRRQLGAHGVVRDAALQQQAVAAVISRAAELGWQCDWQGVSKLPGEAGNVEWFIRLKKLSTVGLSTADGGHS